MGSPDGPGQALWFCVSTFFFLFSFFSFGPGSKGAEISLRFGDGSNPTSLCLLRIYDSTVLLHPQIFQHFSPASWANLIFFLQSAVFLRKRIHNIHLVFFFLFFHLSTWRYCFFTQTKSCRSVGRMVGRSVTSHRKAVICYTS